MNVSKILVDYLKGFEFLTKEDIDLFSSITEVRIFAQGEKLVQEGAVHIQVHFVLMGLIRAYQIKENGAERTLWIGDAGSHIADPVSLFAGKPSGIIMEVIEEAVIARFDLQKMEKLEQARPNILWFRCRSQQRMIQELYSRIHFLNMLTPQERFLSLKAHHPDYFSRIQQKHLASYLGVSEVHMSRLKKQVSEG